MTEKIILSLCLLSLCHIACKADYPALCVDHHGRISLAEIRKGKNPELEVTKRYFTLSYFHEIASWKWKPVVTQKYDRKYWPTKIPQGKANGNKFIYNGRISTCPYRIEISRPTPGQVRVKYLVDYSLKPNSSVQEKEFRQLSAQGIVFKTDKKMTSGLMKFGKTGSSMLGKFKSGDLKCRISLQDEAVKNYRRKTAQNNKKEWMNLLEVKSSKQTDFALVLDIEIPSDLAVVFDNRRFAVRSIQDNWREINMEYDSYPIDLSSVVLDAPAGKYGFLTVSDGKFRFQGKPGVNQYFAGTTLVHSSKFPLKKEAERMAARIAAMGCNLLRLHHVDYFIPGFGIFDREDMKKGKTGKFDAELLDRMDYLIYCLKQKGVYIHLDGITARKFLDNDKITQGRKLTFGLKGSAFLSEDPELFKLQQDYLKKLWNHVNPYTKLAYKDDPAIITASIINETDLYQHHSLKHHFPSHYRELFLKLFKQWKDKRVSEGTNIDEHKERVEDQFRASLMSNYFQKMTAMFKKLNPYRPVCGTTWIGPKRLPLLSCYESTDYTADHPYRNDLINSSELNIFQPGKRHFSYLSLAKLYNKPVMHEEWNSMGKDRAGTMALAMAVMSACDHDISTQFALFHRFDLSEKTKDVISLNIAFDPARAFVLSALNLAFIRRDFKPNPNEYIYMLTDQVLWGRGKGSLDKEKFYDIYPSYHIASFYGRCSFAFSKDDAKKALHRNPDAQIVYPGKKPCDLPAPETYPIKSGSKEIELYWKDSYVLGKTPRTKMALGAWPKHGEIKLGDGISIKIDNAETADAVLTSLNSSPLVKSKSMLLVVTGQVELKGIYYDPAGKNPVAPSSEIVAEPLSGVVVLPLSLRNVKVWSRMPDNTRGKRIQAVKSSTGWTIKLSGESLVYEIASE